MRAFALLNSTGINKLLSALLVLSVENRPAQRFNEKSSIQFNEQFGHEIDRRRFFSRARNNELDGMIKLALVKKLNFLASKERNFIK